MTRSGTGLECHVSENGSVEVQLAAGLAKLTEHQVARSPVLSSIAETPGSGVLPLSERAFTCWHRYETALGRQTVEEAKLVLQTGIFLQDAKATESAAAYIAQLIRKAVRPAFVSFGHSSLSFPSYSSFKLQGSPALQNLIEQLMTLQQIDAAEIARHLSLVDVLVYAQHSHQDSFQSPGLVAGSLDMAELMQFATSKFVHAFFEAAAPTISHSGSAALSELHLPVRCFTDSNITPLQPIQNHLSSLHTLSVAYSIFLEPSLRNVKPPFTDFLCTLATHSSLKHLSFAVPGLPDKAKRLSDCRPVNRLMKCIQSLTSLTALQLSAPYLALDTRPTFLTAFPELVHLHLGMRGLDGVRTAEVQARVLGSLLNLPTTLRSLHLDFSIPIPEFSHFNLVFVPGGFNATHLQLLRSQACAQPLYPHLTYLVFQGLLPLGRDWAWEHTVLRIDATCTPDATVQADVAVCIRNCDAVGDEGLKVPLRYKPRPPEDPTTSLGGLAALQDLDVRLRVRSLVLQHCILMDDFDEFLEQEHMHEDRPGGYLCQLTRAAVHEESGNPGRSRSQQVAGAVEAGWEAPTLVGEDAIDELCVCKELLQLPAFRSLVTGEGALLHLNWRSRMAEEWATRAKFFTQLASLKGTRLRKLKYVIRSFWQDSHDLIHSGPSAHQERSWAAAELQQEELHQWKRQTCGDGAAETTPHVGPGALAHLHVDIEGFGDTIDHDISMLQVICSGVFTGLQSLKLMSRLPAEWLPYALHRVFVPELHNLSTLTSLTQLVIQRTPGVCVLIEILSTLTGLEVLSAIGVEHSGDSLRELGSYLSKYNNLRRLELNIQPLGAAAHAAVGSQGRGSQSAYGFYARPGRAGSDAMEEPEHHNGICAVELAAQCGCDVEDLLESESDHEEELEQFGEEGDPARKDAAADFWRRLWRGIGGLPLKDGVSVTVPGASVGYDPTLVLT